MGRLIDADVLKGVFDPNAWQGETLRTVIDNTPTAYDIDKVVYQLQENTHYDGERCYFIPEEAIRIVKAGGVSE